MPTFKGKCRYIFPTWRIWVWYIKWLDTIERNHQAFTRFQTCSEGPAKPTFCDCNGYSFSFCSHFVDQLGSNQSLQMHHVTSRFRACKGCQVTLTFSCLHGPFALLRGCRYVVWWDLLSKDANPYPKWPCFFHMNEIHCKPGPFQLIFKAENRRLHMDIPLNIATFQLKCRFLRSSDMQ